jgi:hypothetical protein
VEYNGTYHQQLEIDAQSMISLISTDLYAMEKGMRQCCSHKVPKEIWDRVLAFLKSYFAKVPETKNFKVNYKFYDLKGEDHDYYEVFIYKYDHQLEIFQVIEYAEENNIGNPKVLYVTEWMKGALFGYSSESNELHLAHYPRPNKEVFSNL